LLRKIPVHACQVGEALGGEDARHARLAAASQEWNDVSTLASERGELVDDRETRSGSLRRDADQVEQNPGANFGCEFRIRRRVQAEQDRLPRPQRVLQCKSRPEVRRGYSFKHQPESGAHTGDTLFFRLPEPGNLTSQSSRLRSLQPLEQY
jgi:hypothetical protein